MALGDIIPKQESNGFGLKGSESYTVVASSTLINAGEPVGKALGAVAVLPLATNKPVVGADYICGIAATTSTNTASVAGTVNVIPTNTGITWLATPKVPATWNTQSAYDALVGARVLLDLTAGSYTILASDNSTYGCVVEPLDISIYPDKVAFKFRAGCNYLA
jgi:hypothetical protein